MITFVKTDMNLEEAIVAYFRALHWQSSEGTGEKNDGGARHCNHFVAISLDGHFTIHYM
jgi:hypothetical protein